MNYYGKEQFRNEKDSEDKTFDKDKNNTIIDDVRISSLLATRLSWAELLLQSHFVVLYRLFLQLLRVFAWEVLYYLTGDVALFDHLRHGYCDLDRLLRYRRDW